MCMLSQVSKPLIIARIMLHESRAKICMSLNVLKFIMPYTLVSKRFSGLATINFVRSQ